MRYDQIKIKPTGERSKVSEQELDEVAMSPGALKQFAASPAAKGMQAGFEAELIFSGLGGAEYSEPEYEPDYDADQRADSIDDIIEFFRNGDFADMSQRQEREVRNQMEEEFYDWRNEKMMEDWAVDQDGAIRDMIANEEPDLSDEELEERVTAALKEQNDDYDNALEAYSDEWDAGLDDSDWLRDIGIRYMTDAADNYELNWPHYRDVNDSEYSEGGFSEENAQRLADDLEAELGVKTTVAGGYHSAKRDTSTWIFEPDSSLDPSDSDDMPVEIVSPPMPLSQALEIMPKFFAWAENNGAYANKTTGFHMSVSMPDHASDNLDYTKLALFLGDEYVLQQFGRAANTYAKAAIQKIRERRGNVDVSKALTQMRTHLSQMASNALASPSGFGKYTSINPKDNYIEFRSAGGKDYFRDMDKIQNTLMRYARATSIAMDPDSEKKEYAKKLYKLLSKVETQQVVDPKTGSKTVKVKPSADADAISIFSRYVAGELPKSALKSFIKVLQHSREVAKNPPAPAEKIQWRVTHPNGISMIQVSASSADEAINIAQREWRDRMNPNRVYRAEPVSQTTQTAQTTTPLADDPAGNYILRRRQGSDGVGPVLYRFTAANTVDAMAAARQWTNARGIERLSVWLDNAANVPPEVLNDRPTDLPSQTDAENRMALGDQTFDANYEIIDNRNQTSVFKFIANTIDDASRKLADWKAAAGLPADTQDYGIRRIAPRSNSIPEVPLDTAQNFSPVQTEPQNFPAAGNSFSGEWKVVDGLGREVHRFGGIGNSQADANRVAREWAQRTGFDGNLEVYPVMR